MHAWDVFPRIQEEMASSETRGTMEMPERGPGAGAVLPGLQLTGIWLAAEGAFQREPLMTIYSFSHSFIKHLQSFSIINSGSYKEEKEKIFALKSSQAGRREKNLHN